MNPTSTIFLGLLLGVFLIDFIASVRKEDDHIQVQIGTGGSSLGRRLLNNGSCPGNRTEVISPTKTTYHYPRDANRFLISACLRFDFGCDRRAAMVFCESRGFTNVTSFKQFKNSGLKCGPTIYVVEKRRICSGGNCLAFASVTCDKGS